VSGAATLPVVLHSLLPCDDSMYELLWVKVVNMFLGVLYHPPRPNYTAKSMLN